MKNNIAYADRDLEFIKKRERIYTTYSKLRGGYRKILNYKNKQIKQILLYPTIKEERDLSNVLNRIAWYIPFRKDLKVFIPVADTLSNVAIKSLTPPENQMPYLNKFVLDHVNLIREKDIKRYFQSDALLVHKWKYLSDKNIMIRLHKTFVVDEDFFRSIEADTYRNLCYNTLPTYEISELKRLSMENFQRMQEINKGKEIAYCFATGPSFDKYKDFNYAENSFKVICNTAVKNNDFLNFITPDLLAFADPVWHFGLSKYADVFRESVRNVVDKYDCFVIVPEMSAPLILSHYPQLKKNIIGLKWGTTINFPTVEKFWTYMGGGVLTAFMLPVASSISKEIYILGADGRTPDEKYISKHSKNAQFSDLMETCFNTHPSVFRDVDYEDQYEDYCKKVEYLIRYGEKLGKKYCSLTPSYIPALRKRYVGVGDNK